MLAGILNELGLKSPSSLKLSGTLGVSDFTTLRNIQSLEHLDISRVNLSVLPTEAFLECTNIKSVILPNTLTAIGTQAFWGSSLVSISIPASVEEIRGSAFFGCSSLKTVTFGSKLKTIGSDVFLNCTSLTMIEIPASVETIEDQAFEGCSLLATVTFEKGSQLKTVDGFSNCTALTTVDMSACTQVTRIEYRAFYEDSKLQLFKIGTRTPPSCGRNVFTGINSYSVLKVPAGCVDAYKNATGWKEFTTISELDE